MSPVEAGVIEIRLLGRFSARRSGEEIPPTVFGGRLTRTLVRLLITHRGEFVSHDVLADALWPGRLPADPVASLQVLVTRARRALGDRSLLVTGAGGYSFVTGSRCIVDAEVFEAAVATGRERLAAGQAGLALRELRAALERWQGDPLAEDAYEDWAQTYRARLTRAHVQALEDAAAAAMAVRDPVQAVALAQEAVTREPLRESARQPRGRRDVLSLLALLGRETPARILAAALIANETELLDHLDALTRADLARLGDHGWAPAHDLVGETVSAGLGQAERGRLHHLLARALAAEHGDSAELAKHLAAADDRTAAAAAYATATRDRLERFAGDEALRLADAGLSLDPETTVRSALLGARAEGRAVAGDLRGARADLQSVLGMGLSGPERARIQARMAMLTMGQDLGQATEFAEMALTEAAADRAARAEALAVAAFVDLNTGRLDLAEARSTEALALFEQLGDGGGVARMLDARASLTWSRGRISEAADLYDRVARLYMGSGKLLLAGTPRAVRAWTLVVMGRADEGLVEVDEALELERTLGQTEGSAFCLMVRAEALAVFRHLGARVWEATTLRHLGQAGEAAGNLEEAASVLRQGVEASAGMPFHHSMAAGRLASVLVAMGELESAEEYANRALAERTPAGGYEAHLVLAEIALLRGEADAEAMAAEALALADAGAYVESPARGRLATREKGAGR